jgi:tetratricopeptide (TPR) repeat protein
MADDKALEQKAVEQKAAEPQAHPAPAPHEDVEEKRSLLSRLNPANLFRKETPAFFVEEGTRLLESRSLRQATAAFEKALELDPEYAPAMRGIGLVTVARGGKTNLTAALAHFQAALKRDPFDEATYNTCAMVYEKLGNANAAVLERKKLAVVKMLQTDPKNPVANNNMGILLMSQHLWDAALTYFRKSIESNPKYDVAVRNLATALYQLATSGPQDMRGEYQAQAAEAVVQSLKLGLNFPSLLLQARIKLLAGDAEAALEIATRAHAMDPGNKDGFAVKQMILEKLGRMAEAQEAHENYVRHAAEQNS